MPNIFNFKNKTLKTIDVLIYVTIRSFHNSENNNCYPSYEKIMERSGLSRGTVAKCIKRLEICGNLDIIHSRREGTCNQYSFPKFELFNRIPYELFEAKDLTSYEKAMLLCLRPFFIHDLLMYSGSIKSLSEALKLSYQQVYKPYKSLIAKGYLVEKGKNYIQLYLKGKIDWTYDYGTNKNVKKIYPKLKVA